MCSSRPRPVRAPPRPDGRDGGHDDARAHGEAQGQPRVYPEGFSFYRWTSCPLHPVPKETGMRWRHGSKSRRRRRRTVRPRAEGDVRHRLRQLRQQGAGAVQARRDAAGLLPRLFPETVPPASVDPGRALSGRQRLSAAPSTCGCGLSFLSSGDGGTRLRETQSPARRLPSVEDRSLPEPNIGGRAARPSPPELQGRT